MDLPRDGREYARWTVTAQHALDAVEPPQVQFHGPSDSDFGAWVATTWLEDQEVKQAGKKWARVAALLVKGPDYVGDASGHLLELGTHLTRARMSDDPETVVRATDPILVG